MALYRNDGQIIFAIINLFVTLPHGALKVETFILKKRIKTRFKGFDHK